MTASMPPAGGATTPDEGFQAVAAAVADHLEGWAYDPPHPDQAADRWARLRRRTDGAAIVVEHCPGGRIAVRGDWWDEDATGKRVFIGDHARAWDTQRGRREELPTITCALDRAPLAIAADISRRFLPRWEQAYEVARDGHARSCAGQRRQAEVAAELAAVLGTTPRNNEVYLHRDGLYGRFEVRHGGSVEVTLTADPGTAAAVARVVAEAPAGATTDPDEPKKEHTCL